MGVLETNASCTTGTQARDDLSRRRARARDRSGIAGGTPDPIGVRLLVRVPAARAMLLRELAESSSDFMLVSS